MEKLKYNIFFKKVVHSRIDTISVESSFKKRKLTRKESMRGTLAKR
ncbi:hypothetical protein LEP1GSC008_2133 [Leptospira kirschneri serovar Bulgarica str. Nikolaevo]|uniref:Uncharacterized protein n=1 Tax=Leptospira kirschneri serovar Bulgarica str. Nikolaevo TaxID=1240687 RepID=M6FFG3_9LEPT|nr:hypothetical protein LEP1GSC008_2133 [Leptospira kirschneri serovar Bulgarica str. Nikolaevo]